MDGRHIFVNAGAILESTVPNQLIGVLAHETGHMAGGHLSRLRDQLATAQTQSIIALLIGIGAMVAASRNASSAGNPSRGDPGPAIGNDPTLAARLTCAQQEEQADRAGVGFLKATGQSPKGMYDTFKRFADQGLFSTRGADPYAQSHPMPAERVAALEIFARTSPFWDKKDPPELQLRHDMARAKLAGFLDRADTVARRYPSYDNSLPARYARAIATYRHADLRSAVAQIDALIQAQPRNPYFYELKGQALLEGGKPAEAIAPLRQAAQLAPQPALIQILLAQALNATDDPKARRDEAVERCCARLLRARAGVLAGRLDPARHGLRPQGRPRRSRSCLRSGGVHPCRL